MRCPACQTRINVQPPQEKSTSEPPFAQPSPTPEAPTPGAQASTAPEEEAPEKTRVPAASAPPEPPRKVASSRTSVIFIRTEGGSYIAHNLEELARWINEGRVLPEDLISRPGEAEVHADTHPLTKPSFDALAKAADEPLAPPAPARVEALEVPPPEETHLSPDANLAPAQGLETAWSEETETVSAEPPEEVLPAKPLPGGVRAVGVLNLLLSLLALDLVGFTAAVGLLRGKVWGRALTLLWATLGFFLFASSIGVRFLAAPPLSRLRALAPGVPIETVIIVGTAALGIVAIYLLAVLLYLLRPRISEQFRGGGGALAATLGLLYYLGLAFLLWTLVNQPATSRLIRPWLAPLETPHPRIQTPVTKPTPPPAPEAVTEGRVYAPERFASFEVAPGWRVQPIVQGESARLGVLLEGERHTPEATVRLSLAKPDQLARQNQRMEDIETTAKAIREVRQVLIGNYHGRKVVISSPFEGGVTGQIMLSLYNNKRGYQFTCAARGPGFDTLRPECERMAESLLLTEAAQAPVPKEPVPEAGARAATEGVGSTPPGEALPPKTFPKETAAAPPEVDSTPSGH